jgi:hypothetical protein
MLAIGLSLSLVLPQQDSLEVQRSSYDLAVAAIREQYGGLERNFRDPGVPASHSLNRGTTGEGTNGWVLLVHEVAAEGKEVLVLTHQSRSLDPTPATPNAPIVPKTFFFCVEVEGRNTKILEDRLTAVKAIASWDPKLVAANEELRTAALFAMGSPNSIRGKAWDFRPSEPTRVTGLTSSSVCLGDFQISERQAIEEDRSRLRLIWKDGHLVGWVQHEPDWALYSWDNIHKHALKTDGYNLWQSFRAFKALPQTEEAERIELIQTLLSRTSNTSTGWKAAVHPWTHQESSISFTAKSTDMDHRFAGWTMQLLWRDTEPVAICVQAENAAINPQDWIEQPLDWGSPIDKDSLLKLVPHRAIFPLRGDAPDGGARWGLLECGDPGNGSKVLLALKHYRFNTRPWGGEIIRPQEVVLVLERTEDQPIAQGEQSPVLGNFAAASLALQSWDGKAVAQSRLLQMAAARALGTRTAVGYKSLFDADGTGYVQTCTGADYRFFEWVPELPRSYTAFWDHGRLDSLSMEVPDWFSAMPLEQITSYPTSFRLPGELDAGEQAWPLKPSKRIVFFAIRRENLRNRRSVYPLPPDGVFDNVFPKSVFFREFRDPIRSFTCTVDLQERWTMRGVVDGNRATKIFADDPFLSFTQLPELAIVKRGRAEDLIYMMLKGSHLAEHSVKVDMDFTWKNSGDEMSCVVELNNTIHALNFHGAKTIEFLWMGGLPKRMTWSF